MSLVEATLAWLGDVEFEREVRHHLARRGDYPTDRLDAMKTRVVRAEAQARLLEQILPELRPEELDLVRRGRNASPAAAARGGRRHTQQYRAATGFEPPVTLAEALAGLAAWHRASHARPESAGS